MAGVTGGSLARSGIIIAGIAGIVAGAISMAIGAHIKSKSEIEHHRSEIKREAREIEKMPEIEREEVRQIFKRKADFSENEVDSITNRITSNRKTWLEFMMHEELGFFEERFERPIKLGLIMFSTFIISGLIPIMPFLSVTMPQDSLILASLITFISLSVVGLWKTTFTEKHWLVSGAEMIGVGIFATVFLYVIGEVLLTEFLSGLLF